MNTTPLTLASNRLPVTLSPGGRIEKSAGGLVAALEGLHPDRFGAARWLGWPGRTIAPERRQSLAERLQRRHGCLPVFFDDDLARNHYEGFSNASLWPLLHSMPSLFGYRTEWWDAYREVNRLFADQILQRAGDGELVWVHDYHLMLLPRLLRRANPSLRVGFFLHTPFPSCDIFRCHPKREALLEGMLGADLIGFHTFGYLRHFRSAILRLLAVDSEIASVRHEGHVSSLGVHPIGIDAAKFEREMLTPGFARCCESATRAYAGKRLVLSVERMDYTKGIVRRLDAIELFLSRLEARDREEIRFLFISVPTRGGVDAYRELRETVERRVGRINGQYATLRSSPIHFIHQSVGFTELCALYAMADVALVTPLVDGMNLVAKEFIACQGDVPACKEAGKGGGREGPGVLVVSEFAGVAQELPHALIVNPFDVPDVAAAIARALAMPADERRRRMWPMRDRIRTHDAAAWASGFLADLTKASDRATCAPQAAADAVIRRLSDAVRSGRRVAMFLDYDGTLCDIVPDPAAATPSPALCELLSALALTPGIDVALVSGRTTDDLDRFFNAPTPYTIVAEHGAAVRGAGTVHWHRLDRNLDLSWKQAVRQVLDLYQRSTPGSHVEEKRTGLVWHYRQAEPEFGRWKANQLVEELSLVAASLPVVIRHGRKIVEAASAGIGKADVVRHLLGENDDYDLTLLAGDDTTDESMFRLAPHDDERVLTIHVGHRETAARYRLPDPASLLAVLRTAAASPNDLPGGAGEASRCSSKNTPPALPIFRTLVAPPQQVCHSRD